MENNINSDISKTTENVVNTMLDKVDQSTDTGKDLVKASIVNTQKVVEKGIDQLNSAKEQSLKQYDKMTSEFSRCMTEKPVQSFFAIASISALVALWLARSKDSNN